VNDPSATEDGGSTVELSVGRVVHGGHCVARLDGRQAELPARRPRRERPLRHATMLLVRDEAGRVLLQRRPVDGLWGGLWGLPEPDDGQDVALWCETRLGLRPATIKALAPVRHGFTHFELEIRPLCLEVDGARNAMAGDGWLWYNPRSPARIGLAAVVERLLESLEPQPGGDGLTAPGRATQEIDP